MDWSSRRVWVGTVVVIVIAVGAAVAAGVVLPNWLTQSATSSAARHDVPVTTPAPEVSLFEGYPLPEPTTHYEGSNTCENLVPPSLLADLRAHGFELSDSLRPKALEEPNGLYSFLDLGGLVCSISDDYWNLVRYAYGPIDEPRAYAEAGAVDAQGLTAKPYGGCTLYSYDDAGDGPRGFESPAMYAFCDGFWVMSAGEDSGVLDHLIAAGVAEYGG